MRPTILLLVAAAASPAAGQPDSATRSIAVNASAPQVCAVEAPRLAAGVQVNFRGLNGTTLQIDKLVDPTTLSTNAASVEINLAAVCNYPHRLTVETQNNGLWQSSERPVGPPEGFSHAVPYSASLTWGVDTLRLEADGKIRRIAERSLHINRATSGSILLRLEIQPGASNAHQNAPLVAGQYGDTLRVTLEPQQ